MYDVDYSLSCRFQSFIQFSGVISVGFDGQIKCLTDCPASRSWQTFLWCHSGFPGSFSIENVRSLGYWGGIPQTGDTKKNNNNSSFSFSPQCYWISYEISFEIPGSCRTLREAESISKVFFYSRVLCLWWFLRGNSSCLFSINVSTFVFNEKERNLVCNLELEWMPGNLITFDKSRQWIERVSPVFP
jgi:hypothetical protein